MAAPGDPAPADLTRIGSEAILWTVQRAVQSGNEVTVLAGWTKALVAHMRDRLAPELKAEVAERWPALEYFFEPSTPHNEAAEGYIEGGFAASFPRDASPLPE
ncbi:MAG: hypothetical protein ACK46Q_09750 [Hyphomonas sp.]